jgi:chloride channel 3/4/5
MGLRLLNHDFLVIIVVKVGSLQAIAKSEQREILRKDLANTIIGSLRHHSRTNSWGQRLVKALSSDRHSWKDHEHDHKSFIYADDRVWYDQFTSTDWVHDNIADAYRVKALRARKDIRGRILNLLDGSQGWILSALVGCIVATLAYMVDVGEPPIYDFKEGFCSTTWYLSEKVSNIFYAISFENC